MINKNRARLKILNKRLNHKYNNLSMKKIKGYRNHNKLMNLNSKLKCNLKQKC